MYKNKDPIKPIDFDVKPIGVDDFYGIMLNKDHKYLTADNIVQNNSGKSVMEQAM